MGEIVGEHMRSVFVTGWGPIMCDETSGLSVFNGITSAHTQLIVRCNSVQKDRGSYFLNPAMLDVIYFVL